VPSNAVLGELRGSACVCQVLLALACWAMYIRLVVRAAE
jgi:hypothetical protein